MPNSHDVQPNSAGGFVHGATLKAVIFDLDGVVADSHPIHETAWKTLLVEQGIDSASLIWISCMRGIRGERFCGTTWVRLSLRKWKDWADARMICMRSPETS